MIDENKLNTNSQQHQFPWDGFLEKQIYFNFHDSKVCIMGKLTPV